MIISYRIIFGKDWKDIIRRGFRDLSRSDGIISRSDRTILRSDRTISTSWVSLLVI